MFQITLTFNPSPPPFVHTLDFMGNQREKRQIWNIWRREIWLHWISALIVFVEPGSDKVQLASQDLPSFPLFLFLLPTFDLFGKFHLCPPSSHIFPSNLSQISAKKREVSWQNLPSWCCALASTAFSTENLGNYSHHTVFFTLNATFFWTDPVGKLNLPWSSGWS